MKIISFIHICVLILSFVSVAYSESVRLEFPNTSPDEIPYFSSQSSVQVSMNLVDIAPGNQLYLTFSHNDILKNISDCEDDGVVVVRYFKYQSFIGFQVLENIVINSDINCQFSVTVYPDENIYPKKNDFVQHTVKYSMFVSNADSVLLSSLHWGIYDANISLGLINTGSSTDKTTFELKMDSFRDLSNPIVTLKFESEIYVNPRTHKPSMNQKDIFTPFILSPCFYNDMTGNVISAVFHLSNRNLFPRSDVRVYHLKFPSVPQSMSCQFSIQHRSLLATHISIPLEVPIHTLKASLSIDNSSKSLPTGIFIQPLLPSPHALSIFYSTSPRVFISPIGLGFSTLINIVPSHIHDLCVQIHNVDCNSINSDPTKYPRFVHDLNCSPQSQVLTVQVTQSDLLDEDIVSIHSTAIDFKAQQWNICSDNPHKLSLPTPYPSNRVDPPSSMSFTLSSETANKPLEMKFRNIDFSYINSLAFPIPYHMRVISTKAVDNQAVYCYTGINSYESTKIDIHRTPNYGRYLFVKSFNVISSTNVATVFDLPENGDLEQYIEIVFDTPMNTNSAKFIGTTMCVLQGLWESTIPDDQLIRFNSNPRVKINDQLLRGDNIQFKFPSTQMNLSFGQDLEVQSISTIATSQNSMLFPHFGISLSKVKSIGPIINEGQYLRLLLSVRGSPDDIISNGGGLYIGSIVFDECFSDDLSSLIFGIKHVTDPTTQAQYTSIYFKKGSLDANPNDNTLIDLNFYCIIPTKYHVNGKIAVTVLSSNYISLKSTSDVPVDFQPLYAIIITPTINNAPKLPVIGSHDAVVSTPHDYDLKMGTIDLSINTKVKRVTNTGGDIYSLENIKKISVTRDPSRDFTPSRLFNFAQYLQLLSVSCLKGETRSTISHEVHIYSDQFVINFRTSNSIFFGGCDEYTIRFSSLINLPPLFLEVVMATGNTVHIPFSSFANTDLGSVVDIPEYITHGSDLLYFTSSKNDFQLTTDYKWTNSPYNSWLKDGDVTYWNLNMNDSDQIDVDYINPTLISYLIRSRSFSNFNSVFTTFDFPNLSRVLDSSDCSSLSPPLKNGDLASYCYSLHVSPLNAEFEVDYSTIPYVFQGCECVQRDGVPLVDLVLKTDNSETGKYSRYQMLFTDDAGNDYSVYRSVKLKCNFTYSQDTFNQDTSKTGHLTTFTLVSSIPSVPVTLDSVANYLPGPSISLPSTLVNVTDTLITLGTKEVVDFFTIEVVTNPLDANFLITIPHHNLVAFVLNKDSSESCQFESRNNSVVLSLMSGVNTMKCVLSVDYLNYIFTEETIQLSYASDDVSSPETIELFIKPTATLQTAISTNYDQVKVPVTVPGYNNSLPPRSTYITTVVNSPVLLGKHSRTTSGYYTLDLAQLRLLPASDLLGICTSSLLLVNSTGGVSAISESTPYDTENMAPDNDLLQLTLRVPTVSNPDMYEKFHEAFTHTLDLNNTLVLNCRFTNSQLYQVTHDVTLKYSYSADTTQSAAFENRISVSAFSPPPKKEQVVVDLSRVVNSLDHINTQVGLLRKAAFNAFRRVDSKIVRIEQVVLVSLTKQRVDNSSYVVSDSLSNSTVKSYLNNEAFKVSASFAFNGLGAFRPEDVLNAIQNEVNQNPSLNDVSTSVVMHEVIEQCLQSGNGCGALCAPCTGNHACYHDDECLSGICSFGKCQALDLNEYVDDGNNGLLDITIINVVLLSIVITLFM